METRKRSERPKRRYAEQTTEDSISSSRSTSKIRRRKQMDGKEKAKERLVSSWAYRNEEELLLLTSFTVFTKIHLLSTFTQP